MALLNGDRTLLSLRVSRRCSPPEIARGNSPAEISRAACLNYNSRIIDIADRAAYVQPGKILWLK